MKPNNTCVQETRSLKNTFNSKVKSTAVLCVVFLLLLSTIHAQNPGFNWAKQIGGNSSDENPVITVDNAGNIYQTGGFYGTVDFDSGSGTYNLSSSGGGGAFISKSDAAGNFIWAKQLLAATNSSRAQATCSKLDGQGNIYISGSFYGTVDFDPGSAIVHLTSVGGAYNNNTFVFLPIPMFNQSFMLVITYCCTTITKDEENINLIKVGPYSNF